MTNNDVLRRIRYIFDLNDNKMIGLFSVVGAEATRAQISAWLKKDDDADFVECTDEQLATFLNGLIVERRGKRDGPAPAPETWLTNNAILVKLKIALAFKAEDIVDVLKLGGMEMGKPELSAFFRKPDHKNFRECKDQVLRNFLKGLQLRMRPTEPAA